VARGKVCILEIDVKGGKQIYENAKDANFIFINVQNFEKLRERIIKRFFNELFFFVFILNFFFYY